MTLAVTDTRRGTSAYEWKLELPIEPATTPNATPQSTPPSPHALTLIAAPYIYHPHNPHIISKMDALVAQHSRPAHVEGYSEDELQHQMSADLAQPLSLQFALPPTASPSQWLRAMTDDHSNPQCPIKIAHGTTTLAFRHKGGIVVATDSRATAGDWIASQTVKKVIEINSCLLGTMAGGAAVSSQTHSLF
jgi:hypothetical protein